MAQEHTINIIRILLLFAILLTGVVSIVINSRKRRLLARKRKYDALLQEYAGRTGKGNSPVQPLRSPEINTIAAIVALKGGVRTLALLLAFLSLLLILIECYRLFSR